MSALICPNCSREIPEEHTDSEKDTAFCPACETSIRISQLETEREKAEEIRNFNPDCPPAEVQLRREGSTLIATTKHSSWRKTSITLAIALIAWGACIALAAKLGQAIWQKITANGPGDWVVIIPVCILTICLAYGAWRASRFFAFIISGQTEVRLEDMTLTIHATTLRSSRSATFDLAQYQSAWIEIRSYFGKEPFFDLCLLPRTGKAESIAKYLSEKSGYYFALTISQVLLTHQQAKPPASASERQKAAPIDPLASGEPLPPNWWYRHTASGEVAGVSQRSAKEAGSALAVALFVNAIVAIFVSMVAWRTYVVVTHTDIGPSEWGPMTLIGIWIFLLPFIAIGLMTIGQFITAVCGFTEVRIREGEGFIHRGWGRLGWNRKFDASTIQAARLEMGKSRVSSAHMEYLILESRDGQKLRFGQTLTHKDKAFLLSALRRMLPQLGKGFEAA